MSGDELVIPADRREALRALRRQEIGSQVRGYGLRMAVLDLAIRYGSSRALCERATDAEQFGDPEFLYHQRSRRRRFAALMRLTQRIDGRG